MQAGPARAPAGVRRGSIKEPGWKFCPAPKWRAPGKPAAEGGSTPAGSPDWSRSLGPPQRRRNGRSLRWQPGLRVPGMPEGAVPWRVTGVIQGPGRVRPPHTPTGSSPRMWPGAPGEAGCRRPLMPVCPCPSRGNHVCSPGSPLSTAEAPWQLVFTGRPATGLQEDVTPAKGPPPCLRPALLGPCQASGASAWPRGDRSGRHPPH